MADVPPGLVQLSRAPAAPLAGAAGLREPGTARTLLRAALRLPLLGKLVGANVLVLAAAFAILAFHGGVVAHGFAVLSGALAVSVALDYFLVRLALRPLDELGVVADRVWSGDLNARVVASPMADDDTARLGVTINRLLDGLAHDRTRMRDLVAQTVKAGDEERSRIARELHDSTAQTLAALAYQIAALGRDHPEVAHRVATLRELAGAALEEVRALSHSVHPRVLDDLGLVAALEWLSRQTAERTGLDITVVADAGVRAASAAARPEVSAALYRVAQESLRNAERHAFGATRVNVTVIGEGNALRLDVEDDGPGFDVAAAVARRPGMGLTSMRERVELVGGELWIESAPGRGSRVIAIVPLGQG
ncbi:MAG TPA: sensor histidine kinase [Gemmatimonadaceae bacterium]|jgi:signal transduction histidine kinase|nr:sensor histidine kinase [Gemmatimonadaceae bacterium]